MALPSPFEPQSETVLGTAILGIDSVRDKSHSRQYERSRYSARHSVVSGSELYELVINTNDETDNTNIVSGNNTSQDHVNETSNTNNDNDDVNEKVVNHHNSTNSNTNDEDEEEEG